MTIGLIDDTGWHLLGGVGIVLVIATIVTFILSRTLRAPKHESLITNLRQRVGAWWIMTAMLTAVLAAGETVTILLFTALSFLALREFITISPTTQQDHRALVWMFWIILPLHYFSVWQHWYGFFAVFIPVYAFLFLPARTALMGETRGFLRRASVVQWALMVCVYALSHAPALLQLPVAMHHGRVVAEGSAPGSGGPEGANLLLFLIIVVQGSDVLQYIWGKTLGRHSVAPKVSPNKTWEGFIGGVLSATALGAALWWATPFAPWQAALFAFIACLMGFAGGLVMSSIKRDRGVKDFGDLIPGHGGIMDRVDSLVFAAPVFFHLTRFFFA
ncbi:phosphatidate cytidylyltransferase [Gulosibacter macacae]|uniref:Phosphatidate cytidylyltransferase n=1 Tax=Gulosibacter macacae TaxID=2488791 RepID=A0A3P3VUZ8_9MICO|nr:phosphatidate cytidylyltransferase [Gulosibacter macacae]RRJ85798.1 phosphatidate cytidylyltransferase [Gulosibacter macacae]